jgi:hypothetical protein
MKATGNRVNVGGTMAGEARLVPEYMLDVGEAAEVAAQSLGLVLDGPWHVADVEAVFVDQMGGRFRARRLAPQTGLR